MDQNKPIIFFDGVCNLCNGFVNFLILIDKKQVLGFASLQGKIAKKYLPHQFYQDVSTVVLVDGNSVYTKSTAVIRIFEKCGGVWNLVKLFKIIPPKLRDNIYSWIAKTDILGSVSVMLVGCQILI